MISAEANTLWLFNIKVSDISCVWLLSSILFGKLKMHDKAFKAALFLASFFDEPDPKNFRLKSLTCKDSTNKGS